MGLIIKLFGKVCFLGFLGAVWFHAGCGAGKPNTESERPETPRADTVDRVESVQLPTPKPNRIKLSRPVRIAVIPFIDQTGISHWPDWPQNDASSQSLKQHFEAVNGKLAAALRSASKTNQVRIVDQSQMPEFRIQLVFLKILQKSDSILVPFEIRVYDQSARGLDFSVSFDFAVKMSLAKGGPAGLLFWEKFLDAIESGFPHGTIAEKIFVSAEEKF